MVLERAPNPLGLVASPTTNGQRRHRLCSQTRSVATLPLGKVNEGHKVPQNERTLKGLVSASFG